MNDEVSQSGLDVDAIERRSQLSQLIRSTFRVREDSVPIYVDYGDNLSKVRRAQHQVIFGRRGSGKSSLLLTHHRESLDQREQHSIYLNADLLKRAKYPDAVAWVVLAIFRSLPLSDRRRNKLLGLLIAELEELLAGEVTRDITQQSTVAESTQTSAGLRPPMVSAGLTTTGNRSTVTTTSFTSEKIEVLERRLPDYAAELARAMSALNESTATLIIDDFYLLDKQVQPDFVDYLHRLTRGTSLYLKLGAVRHRTRLQRADKVFVGVELGQDIEAIDLDITLENFAFAVEFLREIIDTLAAQCGIDGFSANQLVDGSLELLVLASGGVARDFLTLLSDVLDAKPPSSQRITSDEIFDATADYWHRTKLPVLQEEIARSEGTTLEALFTDLRRFCLQEARSPAFAVRRSDLIGFAHAREALDELTDLKFVHLLQRRGELSDSDIDVAVYLLDLSAYGPARDEEHTYKLLATASELGSFRSSLSIIHTYSLTRAEIVMSHPGPDPGEIVDSGAVDERPLRPTTEDAQTSSPATDSEMPVGPTRKHLPKSRDATTTTFSLGGAEGMLTVSRYPDGSPGEIRIHLTKQGSTLAGIMDGFSIMTSTALQYGVPLESMISQHVNQRFDPAGLTDDPDIRMAQSIMDYIFRRIALDYLPFDIRSAYGIYSAEERQRQLETGSYTPD